MVNSVDGFAMFLNLKRLKQLENFKNNKFFDENIFLYLENDDLCKRIIKNNENIYIVPKSNIQHLGASAVNKKYNDQIELSRNYFILYLIKKKKIFIYIEYKASWVLYWEENPITDQK